MTRNWLNDLLLISAAIAVLLLGFIFDAVLRMMEPQIENSIEVTATYALLQPLFELLLMVALVGVIWMFLAARRYGRGVSAAFMLIGLAAIYINALLLILPFPESWYVLTLYLSPGTYVFQAAGALAAMGLVSLWFWQAPEQKPDELEEPDEPEEPEAVEAA